MCLFPLSLFLSHVSPKSLLLWYILICDFIFAKHGSLCSSLCYAFISHLLKNKNKEIKIFNKIFIF